MNKLPFLISRENEYELHKVSRGSEHDRGHAVLHTAQTVKSSPHSKDTSCMHTQCEFIGDYQLYCSIEGMILIKPNDVIPIGVIA